MNPSPKKGALHIGPLSPKGTGKHWSAPKYDWNDSATRICNASSTGTYSGKQELSYRGQQVRHPSRGTGC